MKYVKNNSLLHYYPVLLANKFRGENSILDGHLIVASFLDITGGIHHINKSALEILKLCDGEHSVGDIINYLVERYDAPRHVIMSGVRRVLKHGIEGGYIRLIEEKNNFNVLSLRDDRELPKEPLRNFLYTPREILFEITYACNLSCKHCYSKSGKPASDELDKYELKKLARELGEMRVFKVSIGGGEPTLVADKLIYFINELSLNGVETVLVTNGVLFDEYLAEALWKAGLRTVQFSLDGLNSLHDEIRGLKGCFEKVAKAINVAKLFGYNILIKTVAQKRNISHLIEIYKYIKESGVLYWSINRVVPYGRAKEFMEEVYISYSEYEDLLHKIDKITLREIGSIAVGHEPIYSKLKLRDKPADKIKALCMASTLSIHVCPDGKVKPCSYFPDSYICGDIRDEKLHNIWLNSPILARMRNLRLSDLGEPCISCKVACNGRCRGAAAAFFGRLAAPDPMCPIVEKYMTLRKPSYLSETVVCEISPIEDYFP